jgi:sugar lactone lactonase YvrE
MFSKTRLMTFALATSASAAFVLPAAAAGRPFLDQFSSIQTIASAVPTSGPAMGDQNPYGVAVVPRGAGKLVKGDVLLSNFNNAANHQGTGSSIVELSPSGSAQVFAVVPRPTATPAVGLTTALVALRSGFVIVGSLPAPGGSAAAARAGALTVLNSSGQVVKTIRAGDINGPWDMTALDRGTSATLFVTNVLNGTVAAKGKVVNRGTVVRITLSIGGGIPRVTSNRVIATGFGEHTDPNALVVGPTGVGLGANGVLYVADSNGNRIAAVPHALTRMSVVGGGGMTVTSGGAINDPLGLAIAPGGSILTVNGADGRIVETAPSGRALVVKTLVANGAGDLFGLAPAAGDKGLYFVNDAGSGPATNSLQMLR